jgi:Rrf2 family protein
MILSRSATYGLRAVLLLSLHTGKEERFGVKMIARELDLPEAFLGKVLQNLVRKGIIASTKGPRGGFYISEKNLQLPVIKIVEAIDGLDKFTACGLGLHECNDEKPCSIHHEYGPLRDNLFRVLSEKTLADFKEDIVEGRAVLAL